jgi:inhibitor of KinA
VAEQLITFSIFPLGDSAITIDLGNCIDEQHNKCAVAVYDWLQAHRFAGIRDILVACSSVSLFYDPAAVGANGSGGVSRHMENFLLEAWSVVSREPVLRPETDVPTISIPVCYESEYAPDIETVAREKDLSVREVVEIHTSAVYRVYMLGFLPGFPYMGRVDERLHLSRKERPVPVAAGGVGIANLQTGIYPLASPGGWQIIGRTPVKLFDPLTEPPARLRTGDRVQFHPVSAEEFNRLSRRPL